MAAEWSMIDTIADRFPLLVEKSEGCWMWKGYVSVRGYPRLKISGQTLNAHRISYELIHGEIPAGHDVHHTCEAPACVNPAHLEAVPHAEHTSLTHKGRRKPRNLTHCKHGHEMTPENSYTWNHMTRCRACNAESQRRRRHVANA